MGVDFVLEQGCRVKQELGTEGLVRLVKSRSRGEAVLQMARSKGNTKPPSEIEFQVHVVTPQGTREVRSVSVQSLLDESAPLDALAPECRNCPANLGGAAFGCYGTIAYPIRRQTEQWLMTLLPDKLESTAGFLLRRAVKDFNYDGGPILEMRRNKTFFEDEGGATRSWNGFSLASSQLLQMMFCVGALQPAHCRMVSLFLGLVPHASPGEVLKDGVAAKNAFIEAAGELGARLRVPPEDSGAGNFAHLFKAMVFSVLLSAPVLVDY